MKLKKPIFGICLGHQILSIASGFVVEKMPFGNRGHNIPVSHGNCYIDKDNTILQSLITSQNHGYCVKYNSSGEDNGDSNEDSNGDSDWSELYINANDSTNEGICHKYLPYFSVQFHPEATSGPRDANYLFDVFAKYESSESSESSESLSFKKEIHLTNNNNNNNNNNHNTIKKYKKVLILGSGSLKISQAGEFDFSGSQAIKSFKEEGLETILINPNIATIQTDLADRTYYVPITPQFVEQVIEKERPDCITLSFGGQTSLNCGIELFDSNVLSRYNVDVLGTSVESVKLSEDRQKFKEVLQEIDIETPPSITLLSPSDEKLDVFISQIGYPVLVRAGFCLGGQGSGFANNKDELSDLVEKAFQISNSVIVDKSLYGWREVEYEIVRDYCGAKIAVCNMENFDPLGVHTGESIVVAPSQTLNDNEHQTLRTKCFEIVDKLNIVGECNVQFAICHSHQQSEQFDKTTEFNFFVIEMNARLSRSSALASKATGYPLAYIAAKLALNQKLINLKNKITEKTSAFFEPALDYVVVKIPRWDLSKFPNVSNAIGSHMKSIGEIMAIGRTFKEALQKGVRMIGDYPDGLIPSNRKTNMKAHSSRLLDIFSTLSHNQPLLEETINSIVDDTGIDKWFISQISEISSMYNNLSKETDITKYNLIINAKKMGFSDKQIAIAMKTTESIIRQYRHQHNILPFVKQIDTVAGEFPCYTNYLYLSYNATSHDIEASGSKIVLGSGVYRIGSSVEFDWCAVSCIKELKRNNIETIMINHNPETVSTDYDEADRLYFEELSPEVVIDIYNFEASSGLILSMGGQSSNNIAIDLHRENLTILGTHPEMIDTAENRFKFSRLLDNINIDQPKWCELSSLDDAKEFCKTVGYPTLVRPSYVLSGAAMNVVHSEDDLEQYLNEAQTLSPLHPVVISKFICNAKEIEVDAVAMNGNIVILTISEHIENAGVHSGDATLVLPAQDLTETTISSIKDIASKISANLNINGPFNLQIIAKDDKLQVIECNLRVSRSFPFASKTLDVNMIEIATNIIIGNSVKTPSKLKFDRIGVKVPQFSFHRLEGADMSLGVEMASTGEVACFGSNKYIAYMKALMATGFKIPPPNNSTVLLSIGSDEQKEEFVDLVNNMLSIGYKLYGTDKTANYYNYHTTRNNNLFTIITKIEQSKIVSMIKEHQFDLVINISDPSKTRKSNKTNGFQIRRLCLDYKVSLVINIKCAKLLINSLYYDYHKGNTLSLLDVRSIKDKSDKSDSIIQELHNIQNSTIIPMDTINYSLSCIQYQTSNIPSSLIKTEVVFSDKHIISSDQFVRNLMRQMFLRATEIYNLMTKPYLQKTDEYKKLTNLLNGKVFGLIFETASTRTRCSFESAIKRLGGQTIHIDLSSSGTSRDKGETLEDTIRTVEIYCDGLIVRSNNNTSLLETINGVYPPFEKFIINAGDLYEHPTQALTDLMTIRSERGSINGVKIAIVGDLVNSRVINSLVRLLSNYNVDFYFVANDDLQIPNELISYLSEVKNKNPNQHLTYTISNSLSHVIDKVDVVYMTRLQKERLPSDKNHSSYLIEYENNLLTPELMSKAKSDLIVMHPLPRNQEIPKSLDSDSRCAYFRQMKNGLYLRMTLLEMMTNNQ